MLSFLIHRDRLRRRQEPALNSCPVESGKLELLSAMDIFSDLSVADIDALMDSTPMRTAPKATVFCGTEDGPEVLYLRESLPGALDGFRRSGALEIGRRRIEIINRAQFKQVVAQRSGGRSLSSRISFPSATGRCRNAFASKCCRTYVFTKSRCLDTMAPVSPLPWSGHQLVGGICPC